LRYSLKRTVERHPSLSYGLTEKTEVSEAHFIRQEAIRWEDVAEFRSSSLLDSGNSGDEDVVLSKQLNTGHKHLWKNQCTKPAWKIIALKHDNRSSNQSSKIDIIFLCHHALGDGLSGAAFHKTLLESFNQASSLSDLNAEWPVIIPPTIGKPLPVEQFLCFPSETISGITKAPRTIGPDPFNPWTGGPPSLPLIVEVSTLVQIITIPAIQIKNILETCRRLRATLTGLLHGLIIVYLSRTIKDARGFRSVTPYSMRRFTQLSPDEIANHISYITSSWSEGFVDSARDTTSNSKDEEQIISLILKQFQAEIADEFLYVPTRGSEALVEISQIKDLDRFCEDGMKIKRGYTYELSNIGAVKLPETENTLQSEVNLEKLVFTQCAMVAGPAFGCSVVSVHGGSLVVSLHWQEGIVDKRIMEGMRAFLDERLLEMRG
jgi:hypothetical protein